MVMLVINPSMFDIRAPPVYLLSAAVQYPPQRAHVHHSNGAALMFPTWVRMGVDSRVRNHGQNCLPWGATTLLSAVALVFPSGWGCCHLGSGRRCWVMGGFRRSRRSFGAPDGELWPVIFWLGSVLIGRTYPKRAVPLKSRCSVPLRAFADISFMLPNEYNPDDESEQPNDERVRLSS